MSLEPPTKEAFMTLTVTPIDRTDPAAAPSPATAAPFAETAAGERAPSPDLAAIKQR